MAKEDDEGVDAYMPLWIGDYLRDTQHLSYDLHGPYMLILMAYWTKGRPSADDACLAAITRMGPAKWKKAKAVLLAFFTIVDGCLHHKRVEQELVKSKTAKARAVERAKRAAEARYGPRNKYAPSNAQAPAIEPAQAVLGACPSESEIKTEDSRAGARGQPVPGKTEFITPQTALLPYPLCEDAATVAKAAEFIESCNAIGFPRTPQQWKAVAESLLASPDSAVRILQNSITKARYTVDSIQEIEAREASEKRKAASHGGNGNRPGKISDGERALNRGRANFNLAIAEGLGEQTGEQPPVTAL